MAILVAPRRRRLAAVLALGLAIAGLGCYSPLQPACAFSCAADGLCPAGYSCAADGVCHREDGQGSCEIPSQVDAARDGDDGADAGTDATD